MILSMHINVFTIGTCPVFLCPSQATKGLGGPVGVEFLYFTTAPNPSGQHILLAPAPTRTDPREDVSPRARASPCWVTLLSLLWLPVRTGWARQW